VEKGVGTIAFFKNDFAQLICINEWIAFEPEADIASI
jgi:hypothetical protein